MTITIVQRWTVSNIASATENSKRAQAFWKRHGAQGFRLSQIFTGPTSGQYLTAIVFADMAAYAKGQPLPRQILNCRKFVPKPIVKVP